MTTDEKLSYLTGKIDALMYMCCTLVTLSPHRDEILPLIRRLPEHGTVDPISNEHEQQYVNGIKAVVSELEELLKIALSAKQYAHQEPGKKNQTH